MKLVNHEKIKALREQLGLSQDEVAPQIGLSRPSLALVESGDKDLTIEQLYGLAKILKVQPEDLIPSLKSLRDETINYEKFKQLISACINWGGDSKDGKITKTKLAKLVYLADFNWFYAHQISMTGATYRAIQRGPVADEYFRAIDDLFDNGTITITPSNAAIMISPNESYGSGDLSDAEQNMIRTICDKWRDRSTSEIVDFTHNQAPWKTTAPGGFVDYRTILSEKAANLF